MDKEIIRTTKVAIFHNKKIRKTIYKNEWWFSIIDIVDVLTESDRPRKYWSDLKKKLVNEGYSEVSEKIGQLRLLAPDGKKRETDCANTETLLGERASTEIHRTENSHGMPKLKSDAKEEYSITAAEIVFLCNLDYAELQAD